MFAIKASRTFIESRPYGPDAKRLAALVLALENEATFSLANLYRLEPNQFDQAMETIKEWRIDRYYAGKAKLIDLSWRLRNTSAPEPY